jgi:hypothetical protein
MASEERPKAEAQVLYSKRGPTGEPQVDLVVPHGTRLVDTLKIQELIARELLPELSPTGCLPCHSGVIFRVHEQLEEVIRVDLEAGTFIGR